MTDGAIDIGSVIGLLRRRISVVIAAVAVSLCVAGLAVLAIKPVYTATALVLVDPSKKNLLDPETAYSRSDLDAIRVEGEVELVETDATLQRVASDLALADDAEFGSKASSLQLLLAGLGLGPRSPEGADRVVEALRDAVSVRRRGLTFLIAVSGRSVRPAMAAEIANAVARTYIAGQLQAKIDAALASATIVRERLEGARTALAGSEQALDNYVDENLPRISSATGRTEIVAMRREIDALAQRRDQSSNAIARVADRLAAGDWGTVAEDLQDETLMALVRRKAEMTTAGTEAVDLRAGLAAIDAQLDAAAARAVAGLNAEVAAAQTQISALRNELRSTVLSSALPADIITAIYELQQSAELSRSQYQTLLTRQNELDTQAYLQVADSRIVDAATPPEHPSFPNPGLILALAGLAGVAFGVVTAFLIENFVGGFTSEAQVESILRLPVVASVPRQRPLRRNGDEPAAAADALKLAPLSAYSESIRRLRVGIDQAVRKAAADRPPRAEGIVVMVSSSAPREGKSLIALSLARAYALSGTSTLLVDSDLRKPGIHQQLGIDASGGLLEYLSGDSTARDLRSILTIDPVSGAHVIVGARRSDIATDQLVAGKAFNQLIAAARKNFDVVVLDTPPVGAVVDGLYLADIADAIVFVVNYSGTPQQEVKAAVAALLSAKPGDVPIVAVLNQKTASAATRQSKYADYYAEA